MKTIAASELRVGDVVNGHVVVETIRPDEKGLLVSVRYRCSVTNAEHVTGYHPTQRILTSSRD